VKIILFKLIEKNETTGVDEEIYKIEIPANRYDLLCVEGLTRALLIFQNKFVFIYYFKYFFLFLE